MSLYPIKFKPILKERIWGGTRLADFKSLKKIEAKLGESWELSAVRGDISVVANGYLRGNTIDELIEIYMGDLVGEKVYDKFGLEFPLLFKFIDSSEELSLQVHPSDELALKRHQAYGKTEMWYVISAAADSVIYIGFNKDTNGSQLLEAIKDSRVLDLLNIEYPKAGDVYYLPAGRIHAIGAHVLLAEVQQTSDITYRVYDWGREHNPETAREMHVDLALDAIDYKRQPSYKTEYEPMLNDEVGLVNTPYFKTSLFDFDQALTMDYSEQDSFVVYMCMDGACTISYEEGEETLRQGETVLIPATLVELELIPEKTCKLLEVYIP